jgi:hypothetical protein
MNLYAALHQMVQKYMLGDLSMLPRVREWLYTHADELLDSTDANLRDLADVVWSRISDYEARDITEPQIRDGIKVEFPDLGPKEDLQPQTESAPLVAEPWSIEIELSQDASNGDDEDVRQRLVTRLRSPEIKLNVHPWGSRSAAPAGM